MSQEPSAAEAAPANGVLTVRWPMKARLTAIRVDLGNPGATGTPGGAPAIDNYAGYPFYYHVRQSTSGPAGSVDILIDEVGPSDWTATGPINSVSLTYKYMVAPNPQPVTEQMTYSSPGGYFRGEHLHICIDFSDDLTSGTLVIERASYEGDANFSRVGILVVAKDYSTSNTTRGHFVVVPVTQDSTGNYPTTASIHWPGLGGFAGPVGGGQVP
jgi:hypothetical protein